MADYFFKIALKLKVFFVVPRRGLEPPRVSSHVPETCVSTNFTTSARGKSITTWLESNYEAR